MRTGLLALAALALAAGPALAELTVEVTYLRRVLPPPPVLSNLDPIPEDEGVAGARVGLTDNATTGQFLGHLYDLQVVEVPEDADIAEAARAALAERDLMILDAPAADVLTVADLPEAAEALLFNAAAPEATLRDAECRANVLHSGPSLAMRTDALMQFLQTRRWTDLVLIEGSYPEDEAFAGALRQSAEKFGLNIRGAKTWAFDADMRRNAAQEVPVFTQELPDHDVLLVADERDDFGRYIPFNTWDPRPVAGSAGLRPVAWAPVVEQWGAAQLQSRFEDQTGRAMRPLDYATWAAMRSIGEAVTRTGAADAATLRGYMLSEDFALAGFKGRPLQFRSWNGQLRQPIPLVGPRALVAMAPLDGFLHPVTELDTLGIDAPESACNAFAG